jgi:hypothetical protein
MAPVADSIWMAPPYIMAKFPEKVLLYIFRSLSACEIPAPVVALLPEKVLLLTHNEL